LCARERICLRKGIQNQVGGEKKYKVQNKEVEFFFDLNEER